MNTSVFIDIKFFYHGEFDLGSGRTLAACLIHASRAHEADWNLRGDVCGLSCGWVSNTWVTYLQAWDKSWKRELIPNAIFYLLVKDYKTIAAATCRLARGALASW